MVIPLGDRRRLILVAVLLFAWLVALGAAAGSALAQAAPSAVREHLTDSAGVLAGDEADEVAGTLEEARRRGVDLHLLLVDETGGLPAASYAEDVARRSSMGGDDALLVVAFAERTFALWSSDELGVSERETSAILDRFVAPGLRAGDVPAAARGAVAGLVRARGGGGRSGPSLPFGGGLLPLAIPLVIVLGLAFLVRRVRRSAGRGATLAPEPPEPDLGPLAAEANAALVRVDDKVRDAEHEAGFAEAQFGPEEAETLRRALGEARAELQRAFLVRQRLDDEVPEPAEERRAMLEEIVRRSGAAERVVEGRLARLEQLRGLERDPAGAAAEIRSRMARTADRIPEAEAGIGTLAADARAVAAAVQGNVEEARKRLAFTEERLREADGAEAAGAAPALRAGGAALAQADRVERLADEAFDIAWRDSEDSGGDDGPGGYGAGVQGFGWGVPVPIPFPFPGAHRAAGASEHQRAARSGRGPGADARPAAAGLREQHPGGRGGGGADGRQPAPHRGRPARGARGRSRMGREGGRRGPQGRRAQGVGRS
jgi:hypothetical protein